MYLYALYFSTKIHLPERISVRVIDPFTIKPLDVKMIIDHTRATRGRILTVEDHYYEGRFIWKLLGFCILHAYRQPSSNKLSSIMRLRLVIGAYPWECCGGMFPLVHWYRRVVLAIAYWLRAETACRVPSLQARYWYCGAFCKCDSHGGRVLSDFLS